MGEIIIQNAVKREKNKMYYIDKDGNLCVADMHQYLNAKDDKED